MSSDQTNEHNMSKDELMDLLNEIDSEHQDVQNKAKKHHKENLTYQSPPDPSNQFG